ncbi:hypothetical protein Hanom_Chr17g01536341 [Helianthus anomalus]
MCINISYSNDSNKRNSTHRSLYICTTNLTTLLFTNININIKLNCSFGLNMSFWSMSFGQFCHFSPNFKDFISGSWFQFCCHFGPKVKLDQIPQIKG